MANATETALNVTGLLAVGAAFLTGGAAAIALCVVAVACLAGSVCAASPAESEFETYCRECDEAAVSQDAATPTVARSHGQTTTNRWADTVKPAKHASRSR